MSCCCCPGFLIAGAILLAIIAKFYFGQKRGNEKPKLKKEDYKKDIVYLFQFKRMGDLPNVSPFCMKVELFLRAHKIQYEVIDDNFQRGEKGLLPFIELNGEHIADSEFIIEHLSKHFNIKDNSPKEVAGASRALSRMFDEEIFKIQLKFKIKEYEFVKLLLSSIVPGILIPLVVPVIQLVFGRKLGGYGTFSEAELKQLYRRNLQAATDVLGDKKFLGGNEPNLGDCSVFGQLASLYYLSCPNDLKCIIDEFPSLKKLMNTIIREYFADFDVSNHLKN
ncbi:hypothetical protein FO519_006051 [Halicephalobus sp. NKZ332]|nr:hypothetical protein FO519_006051 [Halicephalobus sp. NKZ332]